jgi:hypothetical protein
MELSFLCRQMEGCVTTKIFWRFVTNRTLDTVHGIRHTWVGRNSVVCIATRYGLDGPEIDVRWGRDLQHRSRPALGPTQPSIQWVPAHFPGDKAAGTWRWSPTLSSAEAKESVELHLYSPSGPSWPLLGWTSHEAYLMQAVFRKLALIPSSGESSTKPGLLGPSDRINLFLKTESLS